MVGSKLLKLSVTLVLLAATAFAGVAGVAADNSGTIKLVQAAPASAALVGKADEGYGQSRSLAGADGAVVVSDWFERHPDAIKASDAVFASDWFERHPESIYSAGLSDAQTRYGPPGR